MDKLEVNGPNAHPMYKYFRECQPKSVGGGSRVPDGSSAIEWYVPSVHLTEPLLVSCSSSCLCLPAHYCVSL